MLLTGVVTDMSHDVRVGEFVNLLRHSLFVYGLDNILKRVVGRSVIGRRGRGITVGTLVKEDDLF